jgi:hypothetical protein
VSFSAKTEEDHGEPERERERERESLFSLQAMIPERMLQTEFG